MKTGAVRLQLLRASGQPRPLITEAVDKLAASMREVGLIQPITVRPAIVVNGIAEDGYQIVAGHHRVAAARALGWTEIEAVIVDPKSHLAAELIEIDENLCRSELTPAQRAAHIKRRKQIWEALHPTQKLAQLAPVSRGGRGKTEFASETAAITGEAKASVNRHVARAEALGPDLDRVVGTSLDKGVELDALKTMPAPERKVLIDRAQAGEKVSARPAASRPLRPHIPRTMLNRIRSMSDEALADFLQRVANRGVDGALEELAEVECA